MKKAASRFRRRIILSTVILCLLAVEWAVGLGRESLDQYDRRYEVGGFSRRHKDIENLPPCDVIFMGSSRAMYALVPDEFSRVAHQKAYNLGLSNSKTADWQIFAQRLLDHHRPSLVILGVNAGAFFHDYLPEKAAYLLFDLNDVFDSFRREGISSEIISNYARARLGRTWSFYGRRSEVKSYLQGKMSWLLPKYAQLSRERRARATCPTPPNGFEHPAALGRHIPTLQEVLDTNDVIHHRQEKIPQFAPESSAYGRFDDLLALFNDQDIRLVVAYLPNSPRVESRWKVEESQIVHHLSGLCKTRDVPFINCGDKRIPRTNADYLDEIHVNLPLARRISRHIAQRIVAMNLLPRDTLQFAESQMADMDVP